MAQQHSRVLVHMASQMIENRLFLNSFRDQYLIRFHSRPEFVSTLGEGILSFDEEHVSAEWLVEMPAVDRATIAMGVGELRLEIGETALDVDLYERYQESWGL